MIIKNVSDEVLWDAERYVLGDPALDRIAFEEAMSEDIELALAVADSIERLQRIAVACQSSRVQIAPIDKPRRLPTRAIALCLACAALAASLLAVIRVGDSWTASHDKPMAQNVDQSLSAVASHWLALDGYAVADDGNALPAALDLMELQSQSQLSVVDEGDWMLEAAVAFFQQADI